MPDFMCPLPLRDYPFIVMGHGGGGKLTAELVEHLFLPAFRNPALEDLGDASVLPAPAGRLAFSTDSFVVKPLFFPGGSIGSLAVNGTVNDLSMAGARPLYLSASFILEEGLPMTTLAAIVEHMAKAARAAGVQVVTGDTKVVEKGRGDGCYITTAGVGVLADGVNVGPSLAQPGDAVLINGAIGDHGMAIMSVREGLQFESVIESDCAPLHAMAARVLEAGGTAVHAMRDPTRGGVGAALNEIAQASRVGILIEERALPIRPDVQAACEMLGLDPLFVANEGKMLVLVASHAADKVLAAMGPHARRIGEVTYENQGLLVVRTAIGTRRLAPAPLGEQLPRIC